MSVQSCREKLHPTVIFSWPFLTFPTSVSCCLQRWPVISQLHNLVCPFLEWPFPWSLDAKFYPISYKVISLYTVRDYFYQRLVVEWLSDLADTGVSPVNHLTQTFLYPSHSKMCHNKAMYKAIPPNYLLMSSIYYRFCYSTELCLFYILILFVSHYFCVYMLLDVLVQNKLFKQISPGEVNKVVWIWISFCMSAKILTNRYRVPD